MTWDRATAADAIAGVLASVDPLVAVFAAPPATFNPPAFIVGYPRRVGYDEASFSIDDVEQPILAAGGGSEIDRVDSLLNAAKKALDVDPSLGGTVVHCRAGTQENWRMLNVAGADILVADLILRIRM
jgi:hypothetical protein